MADGRNITAWVRWLDFNEVEPAHISIILKFAPGDVAAILERPRKGPRPKSAPQKRGCAILGGTAAKVRALARLGYQPTAIARIVAVDLVDVHDFLARIRPVRTTRLVRPRGPAEQTRVNHHRRRRRPATPPPRPPAIDPGEAWKYRDDIGPDGRPVAIDRPPAADVVVDLVELELPAVAPRPVNAWVGPTDCFPRGEQHGHAKLTDADVVEVLRRHATGTSIYALAKTYKVNPGTIRAIVRGETWTHIERPPSPAPTPARSVE